MNGKLGPLSKYMATYSQMYPQAFQVLVTSDMSVSWASNRMRVSSVILSNFVLT